MLQPEKLLEGMVELEAVSVLSTSPPGVSTHCSPIIEGNVTLIPNDSLSRASFWATRVGSLVLRPSSTLCSE